MNSWSIDVGSAVGSVENVVRGDDEIAELCTLVSMCLHGLSLRPTNLQSSFRANR
jgi:hypothetical protein